jgi:hypothetical protein
VSDETVGRDLPGRREDRERDREIEAGPFLPQLGGSEVDRDPAARPLELGGGDPAPYPLLRLLAGAVGEPDDGERRDAQLEVRLDLHASRVEADEGVRDGAGEHVPTLAADLSRNRHGTVPKS